MPPQKTQDEPQNIDSEKQKTSSLSQRGSRGTSSLGFEAAHPPELGQVLDEQHAEETMDISRSDVDEVEITDSSAKAPTIKDARTNGSVEQEDVYEPPQVIGPDTALPMVSPDRSPQPKSLNRAADNSQATSSNVTTTSGHLAPKSEVQSAPTTSDKMEESSVSSHGNSPSDEVLSDSDDYEPPEPVSPRAAVLANTRNEIVESESPRPHPDVEDDAHIADSSEQISLAVQNPVDAQKDSAQKCLQKVWRPYFFKQDADCLSSLKLLPATKLAISRHMRAH